MILMRCQLYFQQQQLHPLLPRHHRRTPAHMTAHLQHLHPYQVPQIQVLHLLFELLVRQPQRHHPPSPHQKVTLVLLRQLLLKLFERYQHPAFRTLGYGFHYQKSLNIFCPFYLNTLKTLVLDLKVQVVEHLGYCKLDLTAQL